MKPIRHRVILLVSLAVALVSVTFPVAAQPWPGLSNPSFEGTPGVAVLPAGWTGCGDRFNTPDLGPDVGSIVKRPAQGRTYLHLVCRGFGDFTPTGSYEAVGQRLAVPLRAGEEYCLLADLSFPGVNTGTEPKSPAVLRIWGAGDDCTPQELLWVSPPVGHTDWRAYRIRFTPRNTHPVLRLECYFARDPYYWGAVLVDNLRGEQAAPLLPSMVGGLCLGDSLLLEPELAALAAFGTDGRNLSYRWHDAAGRLLSEDIRLAVRNGGDYRLAVSDGCVTFRDTVTVSAQECEPNFFVPNVITPDGDGANDTFAFRGLLVSGWRLTVADRWGRVVHRSDNYRQDWAAEGLVGGVYYYRLEKPGFKPMTGWVHVLR